MAKREKLTFKKFLVSRLEKHEPRKSASGSTYMDFKWVADEQDLVHVARNFKNSTTAMTFMVSQALAFIANDLLAHSLPRTPVDTGKLRKSGRAVLSYSNFGYTVVGRGTATGEARTNYSGLSKRKAEKAQRMFSLVRFMRHNEEGKDIALWAHEELFNYANRFQGYTPAARTPGTGPKYLEIPYIQNMSRYARILKEAYQKKSIEEIKRITQKVSTNRESKLNRMKVVLSRINKQGYWG